ncbi:MAG: hypothetical protein CMO98_13620 [Woeseia sp.]|nr:hypothetical protein [Woeseia sp.]|tara:strand:- start:277 stop:1293 length:1017 start_codon:yes stop_codon:yes gene_type:complete
MDWFEKLTGFEETDWASTREKLSVDGARLISNVNGSSYEIGEFELISLEELRKQGSALPPHGETPLKVCLTIGDVRPMHQVTENAGALFQVASQFNMLEMAHPTVTPEDGVTIYQNDHTQGPACAIAAGAATIFRNYFVPINGENGQTEDRQINGISKIQDTLAGALDLPTSDLCTMKNGYFLPEAQNLKRINRYLGSLEEPLIDNIRKKLCVGMHWDIEVTDVDNFPGPQVSQAFCSALPIAYSNLGADSWKELASLVLEAAYEATLWAGVINSARGVSDKVFLTLLGGGAFGNDADWIYQAIERAVSVVSKYPLDVQIVSFGEPTLGLRTLIEEIS